MSIKDAKCSAAVFGLVGDDNDNALVDPLDERGASQFMHSSPLPHGSSSSSGSLPTTGEGQGGRHEMKKITELQAQLDAA